MDLSVLSPASTINLNQLQLCPQGLPLSTRAYSKARVPLSPTFNNPLSRYVPIKPFPMLLPPHPTDKPSSTTESFATAHEPCSCPTVRTTSLAKLARHVSKRIGALFISLLPFRRTSTQWPPTARDTPPRSPVLIRSNCSRGRIFPLPLPQLTIVSIASCSSTESCLTSDVSDCRLCLQARQREAMATNETLVDLRPPTNRGARRMLSFFSSLSRTKTAPLAEDPIQIQHEPVGNKCDGPVQDRPSGTQRKPFCQRTSADLFQAGKKGASRPPLIARPTRQCEDTPLEKLSCGTVGDKQGCMAFPRSPSINRSHTTALFPVVSHSTDPQKLETSPLPAFRLVSQTEPLGAGPLSDAMLKKKIDAPLPGPNAPLAPQTDEPAPGWKRLSMWTRRRRRREITGRKFPWCWWRQNAKAGMTEESKAACVKTGSELATAVKTLLGRAVTRGV